MKELLGWTLETIREDGSDFSWMEESRFDWAPLVRSAVSKIVEGQTLLLITDDKRDWYAEYILATINSYENSRPFIPIYNLKSCFPNVSRATDAQSMELVEDMLDISYPNGYFIWYIGDSRDNNSRFAYRNDDNFLWIMNDKMPNAFPFRDSDTLLDIKLIQLYKLFDKTLEAILYGQISLDY